MGTVPRIYVSAFIVTVVEGKSTEFGVQGTAEKVSGPCAKKGPRSPSQQLFGAWSFQTGSMSGPSLGSLGMHPTRELENKPEKVVRRPRRLRKSAEAVV